MAKAINLNYRREGPNSIYSSYCSSFAYHKCGLAILNTLYCLGGGAF